MRARKHQQPTRDAKMMLNPLEHSITNRIRGVFLLRFHIRAEMRHGISDTPESLSAAVPRVDPQNHLQNGLSCACFIDSGQFQGMLMQFVPSWRPNISHKIR